MADPYETLGVPRDASQDDIRKAYRKAAKDSHPDLNPGKADAEERFKKINAANDIIGDADKRKRYDAGEIDAAGVESQPERHFYREYAEPDPNMRYRQRRQQASGRRGDAGEFDYDIFADLFRGGDDSHFRAPIHDVRYALEIDFLDAVNGTHKVVVMPDGKTLNITIPSGLKNGQVLRLKEQGVTGSDGRAGDAYVEVTVRPHSDLTRSGDDIVSTLPVTLGEALNGANVRVVTIDGAVAVKIPKWAKEGTKLRLRGKGVPRGKTGGRGDHIIELHIVYPIGADEALAEFMAEWESSHPQNPRTKDTN